MFVLLSICLLTFSVYIGSAIYTASIPGVVKDFGVSNLVATLGLSLYVAAYGVGPMVSFFFQDCICLPILFKYCFDY